SPGQAGWHRRGLPQPDYQWGSRPGQTHATTDRPGARLRRRMAIPTDLHSSTNPWNGKWSKIRLNGISSVRHFLLIELPWSNLAARQVATFLFQLLDFDSLRD